MISSNAHARRLPGEGRACMQNAFRRRKRTHLKSTWVSCDGVRYCLLVLFLVCGSSWGWAQPGMRILSEEEALQDAHRRHTSWIVRLSRSDWFKWKPRPMWRKPVQECWEDGGTACYEKLQFPRWDFLWGFWSILPTMSIEFDPYSIPQRFVEFELRSGLRVKGLLALKAETWHPAKQLPLVVIRSGIFSNSSEFLPERFLFIQYFQQMPFHVLLLESPSGSEFVQRNQQLVFGGHEEAQQSEEIAELLKKRLSFHTLHLVGVSLGGQGVLASALQQSSQFQSVTAFCPLVDLEATRDRHLREGWGMKAADFWIRERMGQVEALRFSDWSAPTRSFFEVLDRKKDFWQKNRLALEKKFQKPLLVLATVRDSLVPYELNSGRYLIGREDVELLPLQAGTHCSLPGAYDWNLFVPRLENHILKAAQLRWVQTRQEVGEVRSPVRFRVDQNGRSFLRWRRFGFWPEQAEIRVNLPFPSDSREGRLANERWLSAHVRIDGSTAVVAEGLTP